MCSVNQIKRNFNDSFHLNQVAQSVPNESIPKLKTLGARLVLTRLIHAAWSITDLSNIDGNVNIAKGAAKQAHETADMITRDADEVVIYYAPFT